MDIDVIIIADSRGEALLPLTQQTCPALLPLCGRPTIDRVLESLIPVPLNQVQILVSGFSGLVRHFVGNGERWGLDAVINTTRGNTEVQDVIAEKTDSGERPCLIVNTQIFAALDLAAAVDEFALQEELVVKGLCHGKNSGLFFINPNGTVADSTNPGNIKSIDLDCDFCHDLSTLENYHRTNLLIAKDNPKHVITRGKQQYPGIVTGPGCVVREQNLEQGKIFAGTDCRLHPESICSGTVVLGDNVVVDRHTRIVDSVILDNSYVGEHLNINKSIIWQNKLIRVDSNTSITLEDDRLLGSLSNSAFNSTLEGIAGRSMAALVVLLSLPPVALGLLAAVAHNGKNVFEPIKYYGNSKHANQPHTETSSVEIKSPFSLVRNFPILLQMVAGKINWFGVSVCTPELLDARTDSWQFVRDTYPVGLIGPAQLDMDEMSTTDERLMADATYPGFSRMALMSKALKKLTSVQDASELKSKISSR